MRKTTWIMLALIMVLVVVLVLVMNKFDRLRGQLHSTTTSAPASHP